jgi:hypothetical protein
LTAGPGYVGSEAECAFDASNPALAAAAAARALLPTRIILVRHGESEASAPPHDQ